MKKMEIYRIKAEKDFVQILDYCNKKNIRSYKKIIENKQLEKNIITTLYSYIPYVLNFPKNKKLVDIIKARDTDIEDIKQNILIAVLGYGKNICIIEKSLQFEDVEYQINYIKKSIHNILLKEVQKKWISTVSLDKLVTENGNTSFSEFIISYQELWGEDVSSKLFCELINKILVYLVNEPYKLLILIFLFNRLTQTNHYSCKINELTQLLKQKQAIDIFEEEITILKDSFPQIVCINVQVQENDFNILKNVDSKKLSCLLYSTKASIKRNFEKEYIELVS